MDGIDLRQSRPPSVVMGGLEARLADCDAEIDAAQALRYRVFYEEMGAIPSAPCLSRRRDFDEFDAACDHLLVIDHHRDDLPCGVVGTYRLLRRAPALAHDGFYTAGEFDIRRLLASQGEILELGRSCVDEASRDRPTMQLLWRAIAGYVFHHRIDLMFGCASLPGADPAAHALTLSYLHHSHLAPPELRPRAHAARHVEMNIMPVADIDRRRALATLPPLIKGYLRLGGFVGDGAVVDSDFNTTDVCVVVKMALIKDKYFRHYERSASMAGAA